MCPHPERERYTHTHMHTHTHTQTCAQCRCYNIPLRFSKATYGSLPGAVHLSGMKESPPALGTIIVGSETVSTPSVTTPRLPIGCSKGPASHVVEGSTAPLKRHLKHVRTPPSTVIRVSNVELSVMLKVSPHSCELPVGERFAE